MGYGELPRLRQPGVRLSLTCLPVSGCSMIKRSLLLRAYQAEQRAAYGREAGAAAGASRFFMVARAELHHLGRVGLAVYAIPKAIHALAVGDKHDADLCVSSCAVHCWVAAPAAHHPHTFVAVGVCAGTGCRCPRLRATPTRRLCRLAVLKGQR